MLYDVVPEEIGVGARVRIASKLIWPYTGEATGTIVLEHPHYNAHCKGFSDDLRNAWGIDFDLNSLPGKYIPENLHTLDHFLPKPTGRWYFEHYLELI